MTLMLEPKVDLGSSGSLAPASDERAGAESPAAIDREVGPSSLAPHQGDGVAAGPESEATLGPVPPLLASLCASWEDIQRTRLALLQRGRADLAEKMRPIEAAAGRDVRRELERQPVWPWLSAYKGLGGVHVARLVAIIGDPHRFPGTVCGDGHHHRPELAGTPCPLVLADESVCLRIVGPLRRGAGVRPLWRYLGLDVDDTGRSCRPSCKIVEPHGHSPARRKGVKADWNPRGRTVCLMPDGIADQIVRHRVEPWRSEHPRSYERTKARLMSERGVEISAGIDDPRGPALATTSGEAEPMAVIETVSGLPATTSGAEVEGRTGSDRRIGLRPYQADAIARKVAVKAFAGDLLTAMKAATP